MTSYKFHIRDSIHGDISLPIEVKGAINHRYFQRLRNISQNGLLYLVFPCARHSRFEHSLGTGYLANVWFNNYIDCYEGSFKESEDQYLEDGTVLRFKETRNILKRLKDGSGNDARKKWELVVTLAGLMHDIGHGPLSHAIEELNVLKLDKYIPSCNDEFIHEYLSKKRSNGEENIFHEDIGLIYLSKIFGDLSAGGGDSFWCNKENLYLIASLFNKGFKSYYVKQSECKSVTYIKLFSLLISSFIDVDRFDYLLRDSYNSGTKYSFELDRMIKSFFPVLVSDRNDSKVEDMKVAYFGRSKNIHLIDHFLFSLYQFYLQILFHPRQVQFYDQLRLFLKTIDERGRLDLDFSFGWHEEASDISFFEEIDCDGIVKKLLGRGYKNKVRLGIGTSILESVSDWNLAEVKVSRKILKDSQMVWLENEYPSNDSKSLRFSKWTDLSLIASKLSSESSSPKVWWKCTDFSNDIDKIEGKDSDPNSSQKIA